MQPETSQKPVMDVKAPPAKQAGDDTPVRANEASTPQPAATVAKKPSVRQKQPAELPIAAIVLTVIVMLGLSGLSVVVYMKSR